MSGHGFYVWSAYLLTLLALVGEVLLLLYRRRRIGTSGRQNRGVTR